MEWKQYTFFREEDRALVQGMAASTIKDNGIVWYLDFDNLSAKDASFFVSEFRRCLSTCSFSGEISGEIKDVREKRFISIPYEFVKNIY